MKLVACAIASLSAPFQADPTGDEPPMSQRFSRLACADRETASSYYLAAKKRLGLLQPSLTYLQCLFLFGVYEMYCLSPLQAWFYFNRACVDFRNVMWVRSQQQRVGNEHSPLQQHDQHQRRLEQRLYWSCMKSE